MGYDFFLIGEHHFMDNQWNPAPQVLLGAMAARTSVMRLGTNVLLTPLHSPLRLAEDLAVLDNISGGRLEMVFGSASITREFDTFGIDPDSRFGRVWETLEVLRRCFSEDTVDHAGKYFNYPNIRLTTKPVQQPFPLWFGGFGPKMIARAGKEGYHFFGSRNLDIYTEALKAAGRNVEDFNVGQASLAITVVATEADAEEARQRAARAESARAAEYNERGRDLAFQYSAPTSQQPLVGTPDTILKTLEPRLKDSIFTHFETGLTSAELFAKEIIPVLHQWGREPVGTKVAT
jgi:alkanesulfonate monooxygenase SsuD/methylene tetrahydromethanopterin reductase-like flavin-dependent oxidoreductase (luciferase family)